eukprot:NODE_26255_length_557_cov_12.074419.p1 GENE.NODE_26255_length_557_cov_12.074419~~NODE_26255_length_557_cov_12.074419.p1  ORF type:complete len:106 (-),score=7.57 NODE_26255_length_557_cov_12.074419:43-360(-)
MASLDLSAELQLSAMSPLALALHACGHGTYVITRLSPTETEDSSLSGDLVPALSRRARRSASDSGGRSACIKRAQHHPARMVSTPAWRHWLWLLLPVLPNRTSPS